MKNYDKFAYVRLIDCPEGERFELFIGSNESNHHVLSKGHFSSIKEAKSYALKAGVSTYRFEGIDNEQ